MKKLFIVLLTTVTFFSFTEAGMPESSGHDGRAAKKTAKQEKVKNAVESKMFTINLEKLYMPRYGFVNLFSGTNYIAIYGNKTVISAGYMGRQRGLYPIAGIRLRGEPSVYKLHKNDSKGTYKIEMEVAGESDTFHVTMTISETGYCTASISGAKIDEARYSGYLILKEKEKENEKKVPEPDAIRL